jgi:hypothetical protein
MPYPAARKFKPKFVGRHVQVSPASERTIDGILFASKREAQRYAELKLAERCGLIRGLKRQTLWPILITPLAGGAPVKIGRGWTDDFQYEEFRDGSWRAVVEDCKPVDTEKSLLRRQLVEALYSIQIRTTQ